MLPDVCQLVDTNELVAYQADEPGGELSSHGLQVTVEGMKQFEVNQLGLVLTLCL